MLNTATVTLTTSLDRSYVRAGSTTPLPTGTFDVAPQSAELLLAP